MKTLRHALVFISALLGTSSLHAAPGDLDLSFGGGGKVTTAIGAAGDYGTIGDPAGRWQAGGGGVVAGTAAMMMLRWCATTRMVSLDTGFDGDGKVTTAIGTELR
jgi:hypothetical protein